MAQYSDFRNYFELLSTQNKLINHTGNIPNGQCFFSGNIEEFLSGTTHMLPDQNPFTYLINYQRDVQWDERSMSERLSYKLIFFVLMVANASDAQADAEARNTTEIIIDQLLARMRFDSKAGNVIFMRGFDHINARTMPHKISGNNTYVGWQVSLEISQPFKKCFNPNDWNI